ncbi:hypothetical protein [uncultured Arcobacter sp.]|nr:hypothetical protein [uncultured Arcobacter sp.]
MNRTNMLIAYFYVSFARQKRENNKRRNPKGFAAVGGFAYFVHTK